MRKAVVGARAAGGFTLQTVPRAMVWIVVTI